MNCNHYNLFTILLYQMSFDITCQTLTEEQAKINVKYRDFQW